MFIIEAGFSKGERESKTEREREREWMWKSEKNKQVKAFVHAAIYTSIILLC